MAKKPLTMWFDDKGDMIERAYDWIIKQRHGKSEEAKDFQDVMVYDHMSDGGNSVSRVYFSSDRTSRKYIMFLRDFDEIIKAGLFKDNRVTGTFRFLKKGQAQGIKLLVKP